jgi:hypothetical protein
MTHRVTAPVLETCEIVWWRGYTRGRFQAHAHSPSRPPWLVGESPSFRWRSSSTPGATDDVAVEAYELLVRRLEGDGWEANGQNEKTWFGLVMSRPSPDLEPVAPTVEPEMHLEAAGDRQLESALLDHLRAELDDARSETERERTRRLAAEATPLHLVVSEPRADRASPRSLLVRAAYAVVIAIAAAIFLVAFHSVYAAVVAALTVSAIAVALDSWLVVIRLAEPRR